MGVGGGGVAGCLRRNNCFGRDGLVWCCRSAPRSPLFPYFPLGWAIVASRPPFET